MEVLRIVLITLLVYWAIGFFIIGFINEGWLAYWATGLLYPVLWALCYPIRAWKSYSSSWKYYQKHGISRWEYILLHRRVHSWWKKGNEE